MTTRLRPGIPPARAAILDGLARLRIEMRRRMRRGEDARDLADLYCVAARFMRRGRLLDARLALAAGRVPRTAIREQEERARREADRLLGAPFRIAGGRAP